MRNSGRNGYDTEYPVRELSSREYKEYNKRRRRRIRKIRRICVTVVLVVLALVIMVSVLRVRTLRAFKGDYVRSIDLTDRIVADASVWLKDVEGADVDADWVGSRTEGIYANVYLSFTPDGLTKGSYTETLDPDSYEKCSNEAYELTGKCLRELIIKRLTAVGYAQSLSDEEADALITEALGMPLDQYIKNSGAKIIPEYDELAGNINRSGEYKIKKKTIEWEREDALVSDAFSLTSSALSIPDAGLIYSSVSSKASDNEGSGEVSE